MRLVHKVVIQVVRVVVGLCVLCGAGWIGAQDDFSDGQLLFKRCQGCHQIGPDAINQFGPTLNGLYSRVAGGVGGYEYSPGFEDAVKQGLDWNDFTLDAFLAKPMDYIPGTKMTYPGIPNADERKALIAFLSNIAEDGSFIVMPLNNAEPESGNQEPSRQLAANQPIPEHGELHLGRRALPEEVAAWDIDIRPDGAGLPQGSGTVTRGTEIYDIHCAACHGDFGEGTGRWPVLAGGADTLTDERPEKTIGSYWPYLSTVFDYVRRAMPFGNARSLSDDDVYALTAYLMYLNDLVDEEFELSQQNFNEIVLPNESNFVEDNRYQEQHYVAADEPCMTDCIAGEATVVQRAQILDVTPDGE
jgi:cytochrome c